MTEAEYEWVPSTFEILGIGYSLVELEYFEILGIKHSLVLEYLDILGIKYSLVLEYHPRSTFTRVPRRQYSPFVTCVTLQRVPRHENKLCNKNYHHSSDQKYSWNLLFIMFVCFSHSAYRIHTTKVKWITKSHQLRTGPACGHLEAQTSTQVTSWWHVSRYGHHIPLIHKPLRHV